MDQQFQDNIQQNGESSINQKEFKKPKGFFKLFLNSLAINIAVYIVIYIIFGIVTVGGSISVDGIGRFFYSVVQLCLISFYFLSLISFPSLCFLLFILFILMPCIRVGIIMVSRKLKNKITKDLFTRILLCLYYLVYFCIIIFSLIIMIATRCS